MAKPNIPVRGIVRSGVDNAGMLVFVFLKKIGCMDTGMFGFLVIFWVVVTGVFDM